MIHVDVHLDGFDLSTAQCAPFGSQGKWRLTLSERSNGFLLPAALVLVGTRAEMLLLADAITSASAVGTAA